MKKEIKYILSLTLILVTGISCKKEYLTPVPQTTVSDATAFDTPERILGNIRGLYANAKGGAFYAGRFIVYGDIRGEDFLNETGNLVTGADVWSLNPTGTSTNSVINLWAQAYFTINLCNNTIEGVTTKGPSVVGNTLTNNYLGEARLIRALCYYSLLQLYARPYADGAGSKLGLPLRLTAIKGPGYSDMARSSVAQVYTQIIDDLNFAEANLPLSYTVTAAAENTTRAHRNTAIALKTRVYLSMQDYANVITEGSKLASQTTAPFSATTGVAHALQGNIATVFSNYSTTESIFSFPMSAAAGDNPGTQNQLGFYFLRNATNPGSAEYSLNPSGIVGDLVGWPATDARRINLVFTNAGNGKRFVNKYQQPSPFLDWAPVIRYSEVLLNLAEALARRNGAGDAAKATALLNAVRQRSDASVTLAPANQTALINAILLERRIEFLGEGLRNNDLMRLLQTIPAKGSVPAKAPTDQGYIWPISANEMSLNKLMVDN